MKHPEIHYSDRFGFTRDKYQWILSNYGSSRVTEEGKPKAPKQTFYPQISQMARVIVDRSMEGAGSMDELMSRLTQIQEGS